MIKLRNLDTSLAAMIQGQILGDVYYVNGDAGDDNSNASDFAHAVKTIGRGVDKTNSGQHDYVLCVGAQTATAAIAIANADIHLIGIGNGGINNIPGRGFQLTAAATVDTIQTAATADGVEIAGFNIACNATDHIVLDDAGAERLYIHHNTIIGSTTASDAVRLDLEGSYACAAYNYFYLCKLAIDLVGVESYVGYNYIQDVDTAAKGIHVSNATGDRCLIEGNILNLSGTTGDVGITIATGANQCVLKDNWFHPSLSDNISDSGTGTMFINNVEGTLIANNSATTASDTVVQD